MNNTEEKTTRFSIKEWFYEKLIADKFSYGHLIPYTTFGENDIIRETEKAVYVHMELRTKSGFESKYFRDLWIPKSCTESYTF